MTDTTTHDLPTRRPVTTAAGGAFIAVAALTAASAIALPDWTIATDAPRPGWQYSPVVTPLLLVLATAGVVVVTKPRWARPAAVVAAILAAQVAGNGVVAIRDWFTINGLGGLDRPTLTALITYAMAVPLAATAAAVAAVAVVWREPAGGWRSLAPARPGYVAAGLAVVMLLPPAWDAVRQGSGVTGFGHISTLAYALPWGAGLAAAGWLRGRAAVAAGLTVAVSTVVCTAYVVAAYISAYYLTPPGD